MQKNKKKLMTLQKKAQQLNMY